MNATLPLIRGATAGFAALLLAACANDSKPIVTADGAILTGPLATSAAAPALAKLTKNLTTLQVLELLGRPATTKPFTAAGVDGEIWAYPFRGAGDTRQVPVTTQELPAINPLTGVMTTRTESVYQNQTVDVTDTLHLLIVDGRLIEWSVVRNEKKQFQ